MCEKEMYKCFQYTNEENKDFLLRYYIVANKNYYGINVTKSKIENGKEIILDEDTVLNIVDNYEDIVLIVKAISNGLVTPFTLAENIDEFMSNFK